MTIGKVTADSGIRKVMTWCWLERMCKSHEERCRLVRVSERIEIEKILVELE